jgi:hypothetical protein
MAKNRLCAPLLRGLNGSLRHWRQWLTTMLLSHSMPDKLLPSIMSWKPAPASAAPVMLDMPDLPATGGAVARPS